MILGIDRDEEASMSVLMTPGLSATTAIPLGNSSATDLLTGEKTLLQENIQTLLIIIKFG